MQKKRLGVSLYPEFAPADQSIAYLERAAARGFDVLFLAFLGVDAPRDEVVERYRPYCRRAKELGFEIFADVNPWVFERLGVEACFFKGLDLGFFDELGIDCMRLDLGMSTIEEAALTRNRWGIKVCVNGADTTDHVGALLAAGAERSMLVGCHNYYPHRYTGVSLDYFMRGSAAWAERGLRLQAFVSSNAPGAFGPWPVTEGLPTLEMHRDLPIGVQAKHLAMTGVVTDVLVSNCFATDEELDAVAAANRPGVAFSVAPAPGLPADQLALASMPLSVRSDCTSGYLVRTFESRGAAQPVAPFNCVPVIRRGDVLVDNRLYGQYNGEVQIALAEMRNPGNVNVLGRIDEDEQLLLDYLGGGMPFSLVFAG